jgi:hypothetical protein
MVRPLGCAVLLWALDTPASRAAEEEEAPAATATAEAAPADPTRGGWDSFLDPLRDAEDGLKEHVQGTIEEKTNIHVGAGIAKSYMWNFNDPPHDINTLHSLDPDHNSPELDIGQLSLFRPSSGWMPGFGAKFTAGRIAKRTKADWDGDATLEVGDSFEKNSFDVTEGYLTLDIPEEIGMSGLTLKAGKFVTLLGAELIEPWNNYNFSRSFLFGFAIPFTHTGALLTWKANDKLSMSAGPVVGWDNVADNNDGASALGNLTVAPHDMVTLALNGIYGPEQTRRTGTRRGVADVVLTVKPIDPLTFVANYDYGHEDALLGGTRAASWQGFSGIVNYAFTERASVAVRGEWFEDTDGARTGVRQTLWEGTLTGKYLITQHLYGRVEYRHDESDESDTFTANTDKLLSGQDIVGIEFGYVFN